MLDCVLGLLAESLQASFNAPVAVSLSTLNALTGLVNASWFDNVPVVPFSVLDRALQPVPDDLHSGLLGSHFSGDSLDPTSRLVSCDLMSL